MSSTPPQSHSQRRTVSSRRLLVFAVASTLASICCGLVFLVVLYAGTVAPTSTNDLPDSRAPIVAALGRTPGGSQEWVTHVAAFAAVGECADRSVEFRFLSDDEAAYRAIADGSVDIALVSVMTYVELARSGEATLVAAPSAPSGQDDAIAVIVRADSGFESLEDLKGASIAMVPDSMSGSAYPRWLLAQRDSTPEDYFGEIVELGSRGTGAKAVASREADVAGVSTLALQSWPAGTFRVIEESPKLGAAPIIARSDIEPEALQSMRACFVRLDLKDLHAHSSLGEYRLVDDRDYDFYDKLRPYLRDESAGEAGAVAP